MSWACSTTSSAVRTRRSPQISVDVGGVPLQRRRLLPSADPLQVHRLMPQWDFLDFLADQARVYPGFRLMMQAEVTDLIEDGRRVIGCAGDDAGRRCSKCGPTSWSAPMDGARRREKAGLRAWTSAPPWTCCGCGSPAGPTDPGQSHGRIAARAHLVMIDRGDYWQCAFVIPKGTSRTGTTGGSRPFARRSPSWRRSWRDRVGELRELGRRQAADRCGRPARRMVAARAPVHRRCRPCHVAHRRRRDQPRHPGRRRRREHPLGSFRRGPPEPRDLARRPDAAGIPHTDDPGACRCCSRTA